MSPEFWILEDAGRVQWSPFAETRPLGELLFGTCLLRERLEAWAGTRTRGYVGPSSLEGFREPGAPLVVPADAGDPDSRAPRLVLSSRFVPDASDPLEMPSGEPVHRDPSTTGPIPIVTRAPDGGDPLGVGWLLPRGVPLPLSEGLPRLPGPGEHAPDSGSPASMTVRGSLLEGPWSLMARNADRIRTDLSIGSGAPSGSAKNGTTAAPLEELPAGVHRLGDHPVTVGNDVRIDPQVVLDTWEGPIHLGDGTRVAPFTHLVGPIWVGEGSTLLGGRIAESSIGPQCKVHGEVEASVIAGFSNKAHDGYLGHAVMGHWVNLGAGTTNSDLKNNYSPVRIELGGDRSLDTGLLKVGVFLGDHVKTGIGTMLNTGTVVGAGSNLFGGTMPPRWIPAFSWGSGDRLVPYRLDRFLEVAERAMARRSRSPEPSMDTLFEILWERTHGGRVR